MADSFFGFSTQMPALGAGTHATSELLTADIDDEYDALNDETFGSAMDGGWEEGHEQLAQLEGEERSPDSRYRTVDTDVDNRLETADMEHTISQLVLEDDLDDPAIMGISRTRTPYKTPDKALFRTSSPPTSSVIESNCIGSPATSSIWTSSKREEECDDSLLGYLRDKPRPVSDLSSEDPCVITTSDRAPDALDIRGGRIQFPRAMTLSELETSMLSGERLPTPAGACLLEDVERGMLKKTVDKSNVSPARPIPVPNKLIPAFGVRGSPPCSPLLSPPPGMHPHLSSGPGGLVRPVVPHNLHNLYASRFVPPQLTSLHRLPYQHQFGANRPLLVGQMGFLPHMQPVVKGPAMVAPMAPGQCYPPALPLPFGDPRGVRRFPGPGQHPMFQNPIRQWPGQQHHMYGDNYWPFQQEPHAARANVDEYAGLMTQREKDWLIKIQLMQLQSDNPYLYDYYYTAFTLKNRTKGTKEGQRTEEPSLLLPERSKVEARTYEPARFVGSLGKLQAASVYNPRKIIDLDVVHPDESDSEQVKMANKELHKFRQCLMEIEKLYSTLLETDDIDKRAAALPAEARATLYDTKSVLVQNIVDGYLRSHDCFVHMISIRKGRNLLRRTLPLLSKRQFLNIAKATFGNLRAISKRDASEQMLSQVLTMFANPVSECDLSHLVELGRALVGPAVGTDSAIDPKGQLLMTLENRFALEFLFFIIDRAEHLYLEARGNVDQVANAEWADIVTRFVDGICTSCVALRSESSFRLVPHFERFATDHARLDTLKARLGLPQQNILAETVT